MARLAIAAAFTLLLQDSAKQELKVNVAEAPVKAEAKIPAKTLGIKKEGETVQKIGTERAWTKIALSETEVGYIPTSAVVETKFFIPSSTAGSGQGDRTEGTIAARGFNDEAEDKMAKDKDLAAQFILLDSIMENPAFKKDWASLEAAVREFKKQHKLGEPE
jgi:hypothetical protein